MHFLPTGFLKYLVNICTFFWVELYFTGSVFMILCILSFVCTEQSPILNFKVLFIVIEYFESWNHRVLYLEETLR